MANEKRQSLKNWIAEALADEDKGEKCTQITLVHTQGQQELEIHTTKLAPGKTVTPEAMAEMFNNKAKFYCQDLPGVHTFVLLAFYNSPTPDARHPFMVNTETDGTQLYSEAPTDQGERQQRMRQGEALFQQTYRRQQAQDHVFFQVMDRLATNLERVEKEKNDAYDIVFKVMAQQATNQHEFRMKELAEERKGHLQGKLLGMAPGLVNQLTGKEVFPQSKADTELVRMVAQALDAETIQMLATRLKPELLGPLMARLNDVMVEIEKEKAEAKRMQVSLGTVDPLDDAAGDANGTHQNGMVKAS